MLQLLRRALSPLVFLAVLFSTASTSQAIDLRDPIRQAYDPLLGRPPDPGVNRMTGYSEAKRFAMEKATGLLEKGLGKNYLTSKLAPIVLNSLCSSVSADQAGRLDLRDPDLFLENTANRLAVRGRTELTSFSRKNLPSLPMVGNLAEDLARGQNLRFSGGRAHYDLRLKKRFAPEVQLGQFSLSGGTEAFLEGRRVSRKSVASVRYQGEEGSYRLQLSGRRVRLQVQRLPIDLRLDWDRSVVQFCLNLNLGLR